MRLYNELVRLATESKIVISPFFTDFFRDYVEPIEERNEKLESINRVLSNKIYNQKSNDEIMNEISCLEDELKKDKQLLDEHFKRSLKNNANVSLVCVAKQAVINDVLLKIAEMRDEIGLNVNTV